MSIKRINDDEHILAISVIIPVYNREAEIGRCLTKLVESTFDKKKFEVLIVDDASTDRTVEVIQKFKEKFYHFELIELPENSGGASVPRNTALKQAKGEWILFVDSDDYITPFALEESYQLASKNKFTDLVCMPYFRTDGGKRAISRSCFSYKESIEGLDFLETKLYNSLNIVGKLIRKKCIESYKLEFPVGIRVREDNYFSMKLYAVVNKISFLGNSKDYYFCEEKDSVSLSKVGTPPKDAVLIYISIFNFIFGVNSLSQSRKEDILSIFLNRYTSMIKRGKHSPRRLAEELGKNLFTLGKSQYLDDDAKQFLNELNLRIS